VRHVPEQLSEVGNVSRPALLDVSRRYRLVLVVCPIAGLTGLIVLSVLGYPVAGAAFCVGLLMGFINSRMVIAQAAKFTQMENPNKRALTLGVLQRLGALTAIALLIAFSFRPQGFTALIGLAVFQLLMMGSTTGAMVRQLRG
jgi:riboflavin transporter FmnP